MGHSLSHVLDGVHEYWAAIKQAELFWLRRSKTASAACCYDYVDDWLFHYCKVTKITDIIQDLASIYATLIG
jgi:hypothetical protein